MYEMTPAETQLAKSAVGLLENDSKSFTRNLMRIGGMTSDEARKLFEKALNAKVIQEDRGRVRMVPPPPDPRALGASEIQSLEQSGYRVYMASDGDPPLYAWLHSGSGAAQTDLQGRQPPRRTKAQAWVDCRNYVSGDVPSTAEPDWMN